MTPTNEQTKRVQEKDRQFRALVAAMSTQANTTEQMDKAVKTLSKIIELADRIEKRSDYDWGKAEELLDRSIALLLEHYQTDSQQ